MHRLTRFALPVVLALIVAGCGSRVDRAHFERIENDMSQDEVVAILGEPDDLESVALGGVSGATATWRDGDRAITVVFTNDRVTFKRFGAADGKAKP
ncbi:putative lipoprotein [Salinisphaera sp. PC39]|uniref:DUF3862 domain-containing protein n=1 Tax=Salinisphaera sp. PC39 TaxID=1304156 RepID=UPI00333E2886